MADEMIREQIDALGNHYAPYGFFNNSDYAKIQPKTAQCILYSLKANSSNNPEIHANAYNRLNSGLVHFLVPEQEARMALLNTKIGQHMSYEKKAIRLLPHETTTKLFEEMANLRLKAQSANNITVEQINSRFPKDKYSALAYGLWRIKELEEATMKQQERKRILTNRSLVFYTGGDD